MEARTRKRPSRSTAFDVTCVIGTVVVDLDATDGERPDIVAMKMIAEHDAQGTFTFPMPDGRTQRVTVEYVDAYTDGNGEIL